jgi:hypothetical protein
MDNSLLTNFLVNAKKNTYANVDNIQKTIMPDGGIELFYKEGQLFYRDRYYGGDPFIGEEVVFHEDTAIWGMNLRGKGLEPALIPIGEIYSFVREALKKQTPDTPFRGPLQFQIDSLRYESEVYGDIEQFTGTERVYHNDRLIYGGLYHGGLIGRR